MKTARILLVVSIAAVLLSTVMAFAKTKEAKKEARKDVIYYCDCGQECKCNSVGTKPGNCSCGKPMKWGHVIKIEGNDALVCTCAEGCTCSIDAKDSTKCGCGQAVKKISMKGTGIYFCNCGGSCMCNTVSNKPGKCKCGMDLKKAD